MNFDQRRRWILNWIKTQHPQSVNTLDALFSDAYIQATGCGFKMRAYGAHLCSSLARDLARMEKGGTLVRFRRGVSGLAGQGFPKWVWIYELAPHLK